MNRRAKAIMFQGTGSGVGKSIVAAAMCRALARRGIKVAPFKAQNMALNSFVTADGKEMGRAQVFQAEACGLLPDIRMNPVLLKPSADSKSQVILMGEPSEHLAAARYYKRSELHWQVVCQAYDSLAAEFDAIVLEGAGSPAEINLQKTDIVNMRMANYAGAGVVIIADIDKGGVFAAMKGTYDLIPPEYRHLLKGFLINKFRGDVRLLRPGIKMFRKIVPIPVMGVLPWFTDIHVDEEDGVFVENLVSRGPAGDLRISVVKLPRISNFTDFAPLSLEPGVDLRLASTWKEAEESHVIIIPGTKATISDLEFLRNTGWVRMFDRFLSNRGLLVGICGGYQMLGMTIRDDSGTDGTPGTYAGLGYLPVHTVMRHKKTLRQVILNISSRAFGQAPIKISGYEIHMGDTCHAGDSANKTSTELEDIGLGKGLGPQTGLFDIEQGVMGTYIHGIFDNDEFRQVFLDHARQRHGLPPHISGLKYREFRTAQFDRLADWIEKSSRIDTMIELMDS